MDCSPPGSSLHGILQARKLEWVAMPSSNLNKPLLKPQWYRVQKSSQKTHTWNVTPNSWVQRSLPDLTLCICSSVHMAYHDLVSLVGISLSSESHSSKLTKPKDGHLGGSDLQLFVQEHRWQPEPGTDMWYMCGGGQSYRTEPFTGGLRHGLQEGGVRAELNPRTSSCFPWIGDHKWWALSEEGKSPGKS